MSSGIEIRGAHVHNLKHIDLSLPRDALVVISGPSGSGKSSLALDTIYAQGQRYFLESQSVSARQWMRSFAPVPCQSIVGLTPTIALRAGRVSGFVRTTVGTMSEVYELMRLLFAHCAAAGPQAGETVALSVQALVERIFELEEGSKYAIIAPISAEHDELAQIVQDIFGQGFTRVMLNDDLVDPQSLPEKLKALGDALPRLEVYIDRLVAKSGLSRSRVTDSVELAARLGQGRVKVLVLGGRSFEVLCGEAHSAWRSGRSPAHFSFHSPLGACPVCEGKGFVQEQPEFSCQACSGSRLNEDARLAALEGRHLPELVQMPLGELAAWLSGLSSEDRSRQAIYERILPPAIERLGCMVDLGLDYLPLNRGVDSLSAGEIQRIRLARQLGAELVGMTYVLDEPSIGLHPADNAQLVRKLRALQARGNTVIVVEHDTDTLRAADYVVDMGPGAGEQGGQVVAQGTLSQIMESPDSASAKLLRGELELVRGHRHSQGQAELTLEGACGHNLAELNIKVPLSRLCCVTGVSGSGKSSLVMKTLYPALAKALGKSAPEPLPYAALEGHQALSRVIAVDDAPVQKGIRSNVATYTGFFTDLRTLFASTQAAKLRGFSPARFSFNAKGGRCEACQGEGQRRVSLQWMAQLSTPCPECEGLRFNRDTLEVKYRGLSIADVLGQSVSQACEVFVRHKKLMAKLEVLRDVGLGYLRVGQSLKTMSQGELARLKMAKELARKSQEPTLFIFDEPSKGLHEQDICLLLRVFDRLLEAGHSLLLIEHHLSLIAVCDHIIELGPAGGPRGGQLLAQCSPAELSEREDSPTGRCLRAFWAGAGDGDGVGETRGG